MTDNLRFDDRVAVVTGAGRGLGRAYALLLASRGARIVVNDIGGSVTGEGSGDDAARSTVQEIQERGGEAIADSNDVAIPEGGQAIVDAALDAWKRVDIVINNAGIVRDSPFDEMTMERVQPLLDVHLKGAFHVTLPAWKAMREQKYGRIVNTTSAAGVLGAENMSNYGAAKAGLIGLTRVLAAEGADLGIKVNAVAPIAATRMLADAISSAGQRDDPAEQAILDDLVDQYVQKLDPALVAPMVAFLAHQDCPVSGEIYTVGAGHVARFFIGRTKGFYDPALSIENVREHLEEIRDHSEFTVPGGLRDEMAELFGTIMAG